MAQRIEISDTDSRGILVSIHQLLGAIQQVGAKYEWIVFDLEGTAKDDLILGRTMLALEELAASKRGLALSWQQLCQFSNEILQVIDGLFVAHRPGTPEPSRQALATDPGCAELLLHVIDSSVWQVFGQDDQLVEQIARSFRNVHVVG